MALGRLLHRNLITGATLSGGQWGGTLDSLKTKRLVSDPARCDGSSDPAASQLLIDFGRRELLTGLLLSSTTLQRSAALRVVAGDTPTVNGDGTVDMAGVRYDSGEIDVFPRFYPTGTLAYEDPNWWDGKADEAVLDRYGRPVLRFLATISTRYLALYLDNAGADGLDLGHLYAARHLEPRWNYDWGRQRRREDRTVTDETPGGVELHDERPGRRRATVTWPFLSRDEADVLLDVHARNGAVDPVVFVPDADASRQVMRDAFLATIVDLRETADKRTGEWTVEMEIKEVIG